MTENPQPIIVNSEEAPEKEHLSGEHWGGAYKVLTPSMRERGGRLGVNLTRVPPHRACVPFHTHQLEDEAFYVLSGRGVLRYGDDLYDVRPGDCIACPAGTGVAHQLANPYDEELTYLAIGPYEPNEVCTYPDTGKVLVRAIKTIGKLEATAYMAGEPERPEVLELIDRRE